MICGLFAHAASCPRMPLDIMGKSRYFVNPGSSCLETVSTFRCQMKRYLLSTDSALFLTLVTVYLWLGEVAQLVPQNMNSDTSLIAGLWRVVLLPVAVAPVILGVGAYFCTEAFLEEHRAYVAKSIIIWFAILLFFIVPTAMATLFLIACCMGDIQFEALDGILHWLIESKFNGKEWRIRMIATHVRSKTQKRTV